MTKALAIDDIPAPVYEQFPPRAIITNVTPIAVLKYQPTVINPRDSTDTYGPGYSILNRPLWMD